ncbi:MAG: DUF2971 domain-containing protein [Fibrobacteres bacterium]|nr:DUF2971 domain-containing protein [Fibrobacterota bacterium]
MLKHGTTKVSRLSDLNDVFEWRGGLQSDEPVDLLQLNSGWRRFVSEQEQKYGSISFSRTYTEPLLWAHYAESHKGIAFEMKIVEDENGPLRVRYSNSRPTFTQSQITDSKINSSGHDTIIKVLTTKAKAWKYEREVRILTGDPHWKKQGDIFVVETPANSISKVIIGCRCEIDPEVLIKLIHDSSSPNAKLFIALPHQKKYSLRLGEIRDEE